MERVVFNESSERTGHGFTAKYALTVRMDGDTDVTQVTSTNCGVTITVKWSGNIGYLLGGFNDSLDDVKGSKWRHIKLCRCQVTTIGPSDRGGFRQHVRGQHVTLPAEWINKIGKMAQPKT